MSTLAAPEPETVSLSEVAYRRLRADIASCRLAPGQRLTERGLAARTGLGVASIRDALTRLDHDGLVRTLPRKGYQVKPLTIKAVDDLFHFWAVIGPELVRRGIMGATTAELEQAAAGFRELTQVMNDDGTAARERALRGVEIAGRTFGLLAEATRNEYFISAYRRVEGDMSRVWTLVLESELLEVGASAEDPDQWGTRMSKRDSDAAVQWTQRYIEQSHQRVLRALARWPSVVTSEVVPPGRSAGA
jgi:DNA-binding GntR family transcriptional regulator